MQAISSLVLGGLGFLGGLMVLLGTLRNFATGNDWHYFKRLSPSLVGSGRGVVKSLPARSLPLSVSGNPTKEEA
jgi:hypothetical protein